MAAVGHLAIPSVFGDATNLAIINLTPYDLVQSHKPHSYQMVDWNDAFPSTVGKNSFGHAYIKIKTGLKTDEADDGGEFYYSLDDGTDNTIELALDVSGSLANYKIHLNADLTGISIANNDETVPVVFRGNSDADKNPWTPFIIAGDVKSGYIGNNPPTAWMSSILDSIGCQTLQQIVIPGTHNSGMSKVQFSSFGSMASNTKTQESDILGQLNAGARYLDIRPVYVKSDYYTGHYSKVDGDWRGSAGQSIKEAISDIRTFTSSNAELVIVYLSHTLDLSNDGDPFDDDAWNEVLVRFRNGLKSALWAVDTTDALTTIPISKFISCGPAVVIVVDERDKAYLDSKHFTGRGFFPRSAFPKYDSYANSDNLDKIREDQYSKLQDFGKTHDKDQIFLLSWTASLQGAENADPLDHITARANVLNNHLAEFKGQAPYNSPLLWRSGKGKPNIIMIDNIKPDKHLVALTAAFGVHRSTC
ncbi:hypothetical protein H2200_001528 [Cladophialophora chaetospira]|uniref:Phosphatidylinositol diacylglycerol-lyase n=1 Tax=Cladophialophora chaetospira TaxID=386627 RepID=A0AA38XL63_9EURO|nr:hypothetical protein H2200_001528 [Cladophialophora chaetospira]